MFFTSPNNLFTYFSSPIVSSYLTRADGGAETAFIIAAAAGGAGALYNVLVREPIIVIPFIHPLYTFMTIFTPYLHHMYI